MCLAQEPVKCAELTAEGGTGRICFIRANTAEEGVGLALPLLSQLTKNTQPLILANWGLWHHKQRMYKHLLEEIHLLV